jgi:hypothetical protein
MNFALDFDGVVTEDSNLFANFVNVARGAGHKVYIVTMRYPSECMHDRLMWRWVHGVDGIIPTSRKAKRKACEDLGIKIDVWIDDNPEAVAKDAMDIWGSSSAEGQVVIEKHKEGTKALVELPKVFPQDCLEILGFFKKKLLMTPPVKEANDLYIQTLGFDDTVEQK